MVFIPYEKIASVQNATCSFRKGRILPYDRSLLTVLNFAAAFVPETADADTTQDSVIISDNPAVSDDCESANGPIERDNVVVNATLETLALPKKDAMPRYKAIKKPP